MNKSDKDKLERRVFEVRRTTMIEKVDSDKFVFEKHDNEWHIHFADASKYSLTQMKEIVAVMEKMNVDGSLIEVK